MSNLPEDLRQKLTKEYVVSPLTLRRTLTAEDQQTSKFLFMTQDQELLETVLMYTNYGVSVCVSTQIGCAMGCKFCASTLRGVKRNLTASEMLAQVWYANYQAKQRQAKVTHVVLMGSGEPLQNYTQVMQFIRLLHQPDIFNLSYRNLTISTCGIVPKILELAREGIPLNLAISLHADCDAVRQKIMPVSLAYPMEELLEAARQFADTTKRQVTYEYIMLKGINDRVEQAEHLAQQLTGQLCNVNLIPFNPVAERDFTTPDNATIYRFQHILQKYHVTTTVRHERGNSIAGACGQLRNQESQTPMVTEVDGQ